MQRLLDQLNSRDPTVQADALRDARALPPDDLLRLVVLERSIRRTRRKQGWYVYFAVFGTTLLLLNWFVIKSHPHSYMLAQFGSMLVANIVQSLHQDRYDRAYRQLNILILQVDDVRFIPHILRVANGSSEQVFPRMLERLLPQIRADHAPLWSKEDKAMLLLPLKNAKKHPQLAMACLRALEQIGDKSAIPAVKKMQAQTFAFHRDTLCEAASQCLLYLESNSGKFAQAETLLRSSDAGQVQPDILLRPAVPDADNSAGEQLLRPGISNDAP